MERKKMNDPNPKATFLPKAEGGISFPLDKTALLVIDPVNDFLSEGGAALPVPAGNNKCLRGDKWPKRQGFREPTRERSVNKIRIFFIYPAAPGGLWVVSSETNADEISLLVEGFHPVLPDAIEERTEPTAGR